MFGGGSVAEQSGTRDSGAVKRDASCRIFKFFRRRLAYLWASQPTHRTGVDDPDKAPRSEASTRRQPVLGGPSGDLHSLSSLCILRSSRVVQTQVLSRPQPPPRLDLDHKSGRP